MEETAEAVEGQPSMEATSQVSQVVTNLASRTSVESSINSTGDAMPHPSGGNHGTNGARMQASTLTNEQTAQNSVLMRMSSAPSSLEQTEPRLLSLESTEDASEPVIRVVPETSGGPDRSYESRQRSHTHTGVGFEPEMSTEELEDFLNSPRGQNAIVERSPGGRYVRFLEKLGSGASKDVYRAYDTTEGIEVAWNVVNLGGVPKTERNRIVNEVRLLERLHHHNIISFHGSWVNREKQEVIFVTEILSSGTLKAFIDKVQVIRWKIAKRWAVQILKGLEYLHSQDPPVIHRDLKCENIFINGASGDLRIGDLGLSTVHTNGKVLSVLGTPEFMAPDLYEEAAYNEKVDIYAFGMCLLEIFTKEIPYRECNNVAQIYKKVMNGDLPNSLNRLKSTSAREFIKLCLGHKDESGRYVRPSATELLSNPFLDKGPDDESEVELLPSLLDTVIPESPPVDSSRPSDPTVAAPAMMSSSEQIPRPRSRHPSVTVNDDTDQFEKMPDSEVNIKNVTVMMGRGQELEKDERDISIPVLQEPTNGASQPKPKDEESSQHVSTTAVDSISSDSRPIQPQRVDPATRQNEEKQYLIAAAVIEDESPLVQPYADEILKLIITLPVDGQTQNVQFDFHLVQDDPVQVAREMVRELGIPQEAVLEISGTVSGLARDARMKQDKYHNRQKQLSESAAVQQASLEVVEQKTQAISPAGVSANTSRVVVMAPQEHSEKLSPEKALSAPNGPASLLPPIQRAAAGDDNSNRSVPQQLIGPTHESHDSNVVHVSQAATAQEQRHVLQVENAPGGVTVNQEHRNAAMSISVPLENHVDDEAEQRSEEEEEQQKEIEEALRQVDQEFEKNMQRSEKVFKGRMDKLQQSKQEKEAQHQKTLEKHQKEQMEFKKRVEQEEKEHIRRIEQMKRERDRKREELAKQAQASAQASAQNLNAYEQTEMGPPVLTQPLAPSQNHDRSTFASEASAGATSNGGAPTM